MLKKPDIYSIPLGILAAIIFVLAIYLNTAIPQNAFANYDNALNTFSLTGNVGIGTTSGNTGIGATNPTYQAQVMADSPLAYWRLGDASASAQAADYTGHGYNGTYNGDLTQGVSGALTNNQDTAVQSNGTGKITVPQLSAVTNFSIEGWSYLTDPNWNSAANYNNSLYGTYGKVRLLIRPGSSSSYNSLGYFGVWLNGAEYVIQLPANGIDNTNQWVYWALVRSANTLTLYRNGQSISQKTNLPPGATADITGTILAQGASNPLTNYSLKGKLDEIAVYSYALTPAQIQTHYNLAR